MTQEKQTHTQPARRREMDLMGMLIVVGLVFFHSAQIFAYTDFYVKNEPPNITSVSQLVSTILIAFAGLWGMPLLFLIAGLAIWYSLRKRTVGQFALERTRRLVVPLVVGTILLVPPMVYFGQKTDPAYTETYLQFLPRFFNVQLSLDFPRFLTGAPPDGLFTIAHLWFLEYLFVFTLVLLPLWLVLRRPAGERLVDRFGDFCTLPWAIYSLALPIAIIEAALGTEFAGGWNRYAYIPFLIYGFLMAADGRLGQAFRRHRRSALILGLLTLLVYLAGARMLGPVVEFDAQTKYDLPNVLLRALKGITGWFWVVAIMGLAVGVGRKRPRTGREPGRESRPEPSAPPRKPSLMDRVSAYAGEAQLPFYVLHMTPIVIIGFYVVQWDVNALVKYLAIVLSALVVALVLYDIGVRRTRLTRFLFGMKPSAHDYEFVDVVRARLSADPAEAEPAFLEIVAKMRSAGAVCWTFGACGLFVSVRMQYLLDKLFTQEGYEFGGRVAAAVMTSVGMKDDLILDRVRFFSEQLGFGYLGDVSAVGNPFWGYTGDVEATEDSCRVLAGQLNRALAGGYVPAHHHPPVERRYLSPAYRGPGFPVVGPVSPKNGTKTILVITGHRLAEAPANAAVAESIRRYSRNQVEVIALQDRDVGPCVGCYLCDFREEGVCVLKDEYEAIKQRLH